MSYILPNRVNYLDSIYMKYHPKEYTDDYPYQRLIKEYLNFKTPYHGLLLYFGLGTGKTKTSIEVAKSFIERNRTVFVILPASLEKNYKNEILKHTFLYKLKKNEQWTQLSVPKNDSMTKIKELYGFKPKKIKGIVWIPGYKDDVPDVIVKKTSMTYKDIADADKKLVDDSIEKIIGKYFTFIHYNGLNAKMLSKLENKFDNSLVIIDEVHKFIGTVTNQRELSMRLYNMILNANQTKVVCLSGTPIINNPFELSNLINLIRGKIRIYKLMYGKENQKRADKSDIVFNKYIDTVHLDNEGIEFTLLPRNFVKVNGTSNEIKFEAWNERTPAKITQEIQKDLKKRGFVFNPITRLMEGYALPAEKGTFEQTFIQKRDGEIQGSINDDLFKRRVIGTVSYYQRVGTDYPDVLPDVVKTIPMSDYQFNKYMDSREKENRIDQNNKKRRSAMDEVPSVFKAFSRMACNFVFPSDMDRPFPTDIRKEIKKQMASVEDDDDEETEKPDIKDVVKTQYDKELDNAMTSFKNMTLTELNLEDSSPKYREMIRDIESSPGKVLVYSQFRTIEGIGIFSIVLNKFGYIEVDIKKTKDEYSVVNKDCFDERYEGKRFVIFNDDVERTSMLMALFNGNMNEVPEALKRHVKNSKEYRMNLQGDLVKAMMITESAAEGVSFFNVRRVLIMEPYWNNVIIEQVIGRAIRNKSHINLPAEDRNVQAFRYIMMATQEQQKKNATFRIQDEGMTTDEAILKLAKKKEDINSRFLEMLIESSMDCAIHAKTQKPKRCYSWAINLDQNIESYTPKIEDESKHMEHMKLQKSKTIEGIPVEDSNKNHFVVYDNALYDYDGYRYAKKLIRAKAAPHN